MNDEKEELKIIDESVNNSTDEVVDITDNSNIVEEAEHSVAVKPIESVPLPKIQNVTADTTFTNVVDQAKINVVNEATAKDTQFVEDFKKKLKDATLKLAEVEKAKAELEEQNIEYHSELLETQQRLNEHTQAENKWTNREKRRQYHYNGVAPIMQFVGIKTPMNLVILYFLTIVILPFFLVGKFLRGTIGAVIAGAEDSDRSKFVRGFLWTLLAVVAVGVVALLVYLVIHNWLGIV